MNKQDKKFEKELIKALTICCEEFKTMVSGFEWLTHTVNFSNIAQSIKIICVFKDSATLEDAKEKDELTHMTHSLIACLNNLGISIKKPAQHIRFDSEENMK
ncbi:Fis family transcriptional regulator [Colwellia sp. RE-S-Sl-9]